LKSILAVPSQMVSKTLCTTPPAQTVQYLPCLLIELNLVKCRLVVHALFTVH